MEIFLATTELWLVNRGLNKMILKKKKINSVSGSPPMLYRLVIDPTPITNVHKNLF